MIAKNTKNKQQLACYHCNLAFESKLNVSFEEHDFCCTGCKTVYQILNENQLCNYYNISQQPGNKPDEVISSPFAHLDSQSALEKFLLFQDTEQIIIQLSIPYMHCSSCVWLLEKVNKINPSINYSKVDFIRKKVKISYNPSQIKLSEIVALLHKLGYAADLSMDTNQVSSSNFNKSLVTKIGVAGFCFGNIMLLNFPEYLDITFSSVSPLLANWFAYIALALSLPVLFYSAQDFFISGFKALRNKSLNIDLPIAIAILATFVRSVFDIVTHQGTGFLDTLSGIVLLMLTGRWFQDYTYKHIQFERSFKSYFPLFVSKLEKNKYTSVQVETLLPGDIISLKHGEVLPADAILKSKEAHLDMSFITGEADIITKKIEAYIYAGAKISGASSQFIVVKPVSRNYLSDIWKSEEDKVFLKKENSYTEHISKYFSMAIIAIAALALGVWLFIDSSKAFNVFTSILIIACPCTLLLATSLTYGHAMRYMGRAGLFLKHHTAINKLSEINYIVFDKTGTLTDRLTKTPVYKDGKAENIPLIASLANQSTHPVSMALADLSEIYLPISDFTQIEGKGIEGIIEHQKIQIGSASFLSYPIHLQNENAAVYIKIDGHAAGYFILEQEVRKGVLTMLSEIKAKLKISLFSGDNDSTKAYFTPLFDKVLYYLTPEQKQEKIQKLNENGFKTMMIGDGLNDAPALKTAYCGLAIAENERCFFPSCDGLLRADHIAQVPTYLKFANKARKIILYSFGVSLAYNVIGISFAVTNQLSPLVAAVIMPTCSISIILANWLLVRYYFKKLF